jgi:hypothetical protein
MRKLAKDPAVPAPAPEPVDFAEFSNAERIRLDRESQPNTGIRQAGTEIFQLALPVLGAGVALRGAQGLWNLWSRPRKKRKQPVQAVIPLPVKQADFLEDLIGVGAQTSAEVPWSTGAKLVAVPAALYGGYRVMDAILDARRREDMRRDVQEAKQRFHTALLSQHKKPVKLAADADALTKCAAALDDLYDTLVDGIKQGSLPATFTRSLMALAVPVSAVVAMATYEQAKKRQDRQLLEEAERRRKQYRYQEHPTEILATPVPVAIDG